jgi:hypothetical protein
MLSCMKPIIGLMLLVIVGSASGTFAQRKYTPGWTLSEVRVSALKKLDGLFFDGSNDWGNKITRKADSGSIVMVKATFTFVDDSFKIPNIDRDNIRISGHADEFRPATSVEQSEIKLSGMEGAEAWSFEPIAVAIDNAEGCKPYWFLDSKDSTHFSGWGAGGGRLAIEKNTFKLISPITLCLAFPAPSNRHQMTLQFGEVRAKLR